MKADTLDPASRGAHQGDLQAADLTALELERAYIAAAVPEASQVSELLSAIGVDHFTTLEPYLSTGPLTLLFTSFEPIGIAFYVLAAHASFCREHLANQRLSRGVVS